MRIIVMEMRAATEYERASYGITFKSAHIYQAVGAGLHNPNRPHRVTVWDNTDRLNDKAGTFHPYLGRMVGDGKFIGPDGADTDSETSVTTSAEPTAITNNGTNTGTVASGQIWGYTDMRIGDYVVMRFPDGAYSDPFVVTKRNLSDPVLLPVE